MVLPCIGIAGPGPKEKAVLIEIGLFAGQTWAFPEEIPRFKAMIDTGAEETCISKTASALLGIRDEPISIRSVASPGGRAELNVYAVQLVFFSSPSSMQWREIEVLETKVDSHAWDILLGRNVLKDAIFTMDFSGRFAIALR